jgi:Zn finger protein HypA/HybF involved in hydrogenase expression
MTFELPRLTCKRCGHRWVPRQKVIHICPACKSAGWQTRRKTNQGERNDLKGGTR